MNHPTIITHYDPPPIPLRHHDWSAVTTSYEGGDPIGWGLTESEAIANLLDLLTEVTPQ